MTQRIRATVTDRIGYSLRHVSDPVIHMELLFRGEADEARLTRAFDLLLDAEPVLGCRFVVKWGRPHWERLPPESRDCFTTVPDAWAYEAWKAASLDARQGPQVKVFLLKENEGFRLLVKVSHVACDAGGVKEVVGSAARIFRRLKEKGDFVPEANEGGSRSIVQVMEQVPWHAYPGIFFRHMGRAYGSFFPAQTHTLPVRPSGSGRIVYFTRTVDAGRTARLAAYARRRGATLNDMVVTAFFRTLAETGWDGRKALRLATTVDLRRYLPGNRGAGICNLSAIEILSPGKDPGPDFESTLERVSSKTRDLKARWIGLGDYAGLVPTAGLLPFRWMDAFMGNLVLTGAMKRNLVVAFTNMGPIDPADVTFDREPEQALLIVPPSNPGRFITGLSGYRGTLSLTAGVVPSTMDRITAEQFFECLLDRMPASDGGAVDRGPGPGA
jgi:NRPS condensation-like uncharacterized protein